MTSKPTVASSCRAFALAAAVVLAACSTDRGVEPESSDVVPPQAPPESTEPTATVSFPPAPQAPPGLAEESASSVEAEGSEPATTAGEPTPPLHVEGEVVRPRVVQRGTRGTMDRLNQLWQTPGYRMGTCVVEAVVTEEGRVTETRILRPENPPPELAEALLAIGDEWQFEPATLHGKPVAVYFAYSVTHCPVPIPARE